MHHFGHGRMCRRDGQNTVKREAYSGQLESSDDSGKSHHVPLPGLLRLRKLHQPLAIGKGDSQQAAAAAPVGAQGVSRTHTAKWRRSQHASPISLPLHITAGHVSTSMTEVQADLDQLEAKPDKEHASLTVNWLESLPDMCPMRDLCFTCCWLSYCTGSILRLQICQVQHLFSLSAPGNCAHHS